MDGALDKVRDLSLRRLGSGEERRGSVDSGRRLSALIPGRRRSKMRKNRDDDSLQGSIDSDHLKAALNDNRSDASLVHNGSGSSSLLTDDNSDPDISSRPAISPDPAHSGYLTLSSPLVQDALTPPSRAIVNSTTSPGASGLGIPQIVEPSSTEDSATPAAVYITNGTTASSSHEELATTALDSDTLASINGPSSSTPDLSGQVNSNGVLESSKPPAERQRVNTKPHLSAPGSAPDTPTTYVTPPTPTDPNADTATFPARPPSVSSKASLTRSLGGSRHRRTQSATVPTKLSQSEFPPLSPTIEETKTPGGTLTAGFFSSFLSAAQKATNQFSIGINNSSSKSKDGGVTIEAGKYLYQEQETPQGDKRLASVDTLGTGNLDLSQLGIAEGSNRHTSTEFMPSPALFAGDDAGKSDEEAAKRAVSAAYEKPTTSTPAPTSSHNRPLSISSTDRLTIGEQTPPRLPTDLDALKRTGSVRSRLSGHRRKRRGDSSATAGTNNSIGAALAASATGLANPTANGPGHRLTGFAVASSKRNKDFHQLFRSVPEDDYLIEDYSAALQRDILLHGRLYVSESHICFSSNILGWVTNLVISFDEVVSVEKKSTAVIFPNAIVIQTMNARNVFASFVARDSTYELLIGIWKISHPNLKSSLNGVTLDNAGTGDKTEVVDPEASEDDETGFGSEDEVYDEDADDVGSFTDAGLAPSVAGSEGGDLSLSRKPSAAPLANGSTQSGTTTTKFTDVHDSAAAGGASSGGDFPGPPTHEHTQCSDDHYEKPLIDTTIAAPLGQIYSLMWGPMSGTFMRKWHIEDQKSRELSLPDDKIGLDDDHRTMTFEYIKPLSAPVGPKQTKCITTNNVLAFDLEKAITIDCGTVTPDVPSGSAFTTKTRYCLMWGPNNSTRIIANCVVDWTAKSWLKGPIEKAALDGQTEYVKSLVNALTQATSKSSAKGGARKGKKRTKKDSTDMDSPTRPREAPVVTADKAPSWGTLEPVRMVFDPVISIVKPMVSSQVIIAVLLVIMLYKWIYPSRGGAGIAYPGAPSAERLAAYEDIWRREESQLWDWLEDRVGLDGIYSPDILDDKQKTLKARSMGKQLEDERMTERQIDDAIRVTEDRLQALKDAVARRKIKSAHDKS